MSPKEEQEMFMNRLNAGRMHGKVDFTSIDTNNTNGNTYIEVTTTGPEKAEKIKQFCEDKALQNLSHIAFDGFVNPSTSERHVTFRVN